MVPHGFGKVPIGLLPGYDSLGLEAPLPLFLCRVVQCIGMVENEAARFCRPMNMLRRLCVVVTQCAANWA